MRRYWINNENIPSPQKEWVGSQVFFEGELFKHIFGVCKQEVGHRFEVLLAEVGALLVEVESVEKRRATAKVLEQREIPELPRPHIELCLSLPRYSIMDTIVEKAVELGVARLRPFVSDYSFIKNIHSLSSNKVKRWNRITQAATQQCGRGALMEITPLVTLTDLLTDYKSQEACQGVFAYERSPNSLKNALAQMNLQATQRVWIFVGSEGGFSTQEATLLESQGLQPLSLGTQVLRVETACLALTSIIKYEAEGDCNV